MLGFSMNESGASVFLNSNIEVIDTGNSTESKDNPKDLVETVALWVPL